jgi:integrase/recombinase XerD
MPENHHPTRGRKLPAELYERAEVAALIRATSRRGPTGARNRALIGLMAGCGLRVTEALTAEPRDLSLGRGELRVREGKGRKARTLPVDHATAALVEPWLALRPAGARPIACTLAGGPVSASYVRDLLPRLARRAGVEKRVHPHGLRHFYALELDRDRVPLGQMSALLGHESAATTARYLARLRGVDPAEADRLRARDWTTDAPDPRADELARLRADVADLAARIAAA